MFSFTSRVTGGSEQGDQGEHVAFELGEYTVTGVDVTQHGNEYPVYKMTMIVKPEGVLGGSVSWKAPENNWGAEQTSEIKGSYDGHTATWELKYHSNHGYHFTYTYEGIWIRETSAEGNRIHKIEGKYTREDSYGGEFKYELHRVALLFREDMPLQLPNNVFVKRQLKALLLIHNRQQASLKEGEEYSTLGLIPQEVFYSIARSLLALSIEEEVSGASKE